MLIDHLLNKYKSTRSYTEKIFKPLAIEDYVTQATLDVSPPKWSLGHTSWFFETFVLLAFQKGYRVYNEQYAFLFNSYYNNAGDRILRHKRGDLTRPTVAEVYAYRKHIDQAMIEFLSQKIANEADWMELVELGLQHEQQHQELFWTDLKFTLGLNPISPKYADALPFDDGFTSSKPLGLISVDEGIYEIGYEGDGFCYDHELGRHKVYLQAYQIADRCITNGEFMDFMDDGGYQDFNLWHDEGWKWVNEQQLTAPIYWQKKDGVWMHYTLTGLKPIQADELLKHISYYEAFAFAQWKGMRLPTEFEWEAAHKKFEWGRRWEHTSSAYLAYPDYHKADGAVGEYNGKFMVNQMVLRGASVVTSPGHERYSYRNFFHPWVRWQFSGIRLAK